jgi:hypothetical protein
MAGCFSDRGLAIEVDVGDTGATSVELYLGERGCSPGDNHAGILCDSIAPPDGTIALSGDVFFRDDPEPDGPAPYTAEVKGGKATFVITAETARTLPIVIAVGNLSGDQGMRGVATLRDLDVPAGSGRIVRTTLVPTKQVIPGEINPVDEDRVLVWEKMEPLNSCVVVEHWKAGQVDREFVVPEGDPDCDDVATECNAAAYLGMSDAGMSSVPSCFTPEGLGCVLGSSACSDDGVPTSDACAAQQEGTVCVPSQFCGCTGLEPACMQIEMDLGVLPHITCTIPATAEGSLCSNKSSTSISLSNLYFSACEQPQLGSLQLAALSTNTNTFSFGGAVMALESPGSPCNFSIVWKSGTHMLSQARVEYGVVQLQTGDRITLVPITFDFSENTCDDATQLFSCTPPLEAPDPLWTCAQAL